MKKALIGGIIAVLSLTIVINIIYLLACFVAWKWLTIPTDFYPVHRLLLVIAFVGGLIGTYFEEKVF